MFKSAIIQNRHTYKSGIIQNKHTYKSSIRQNMQTLWEYTQLNTIPGILVTYHI